MTDTIALARQQTIFCLKETTAGTLVHPASAGTTPYTIAAGYAELNQEPSFTNSEEIINSRDVIDRFVDKRPAGTWSIPIYVKPSGTAGTAPMGDVLFECLMGTKATVALTSVTYTQAITKPSFSLWLMRGHMLLFASGCTVTDCKLDGGTKGSPMLTFSGGCMRMGWCGEDTLSGAEAQGQTVIGVNNPERFSVGAKIWNSTADDDNTNAGYTITEVDVSGNTITISPAVAPVGGWASGSTIKPYLPAGTDVGTPVLARTVSVDIGALTDKALQSYSLSVSDPVMYPEEISTDEYPTAYIEDARNITFDFQMYLRQTDVAFFYDGFSNTEVEVVINMGDTAGSTVTWTMGQVSLSVPKVQTSAPAISLNISGLALGSSGEDSLEIAFT